ncbi:LRR receptor-like serine/threonine-protein kinase ERECTA [Camellia sinensis]|uniref:LRR receptor-like serine/threonine-protein kinase ERECTA n=1 Tax=Camellia sinensis TaxID=4442 RepID=UPI00103651F9|nr:LRR receptor-like serine/threonine-protein kinase ERECTA [Camellia sinensis]
MSNASISVVIPDWFESLYCGIIHLDLSNNQIKGKVTIFQKCKYSAHDKQLLLSSNRFEGPLAPLPSDVYVLDLFNNLLLGPITVSDDNATMSLSYLFLSNNNLTGVIPVSLCKAKDIRIIDFSNNQLSGKIPPCLGQLDQLEVPDLKNNSLYGEIPSSLGSLQFRNSLHMRNNKFYGKLPLSLQNLTQLFTIDLGPITVSDDNATMSLSYLFLSNNNLTGVIPVSLCKAKDIRIIDLSNNQLSGKIPPCLGQLDQLEVPDLKNNSLYGEIPSSLGSLQFRNSLHMRNNKFYGKLPLSLQNLTQLFTIDLGENVLTDNIPPWIGYNLTNLRFFSLQSNNFYGDIPPQLCYLQDLQLLNLAQNNIMGNIPRCFANFTAMVAVDSVFDFKLYNYYDVSATYEENILDSMKGRELEYTKTLKFLVSMDLSNNGIIGEIPEELMDLFGLLNLNLSGNHLKGRIPNNIGNLTRLESLDLSRNKLFGPIPLSLSNLSYLSHLNMSFKNLSGRKPTGNQLQTLDNPSIYIGNDGLCGAPLNSCLDDKSSDGDHKHAGE